MNDPIISPWLIYFVETVASMSCLIKVSGAIAIGLAFLYLVHSTETYDDERAANSIKSAKKFFTIGVVFTLLAVFIPTRDTIYKMMAASCLTPANIQATGELADKAVDKVIDKIADAIQKFERSEKK